MRRKAPGALDALRRRFPPMPIFRSELDEILQIAESRGLAIKISDDENLYENLDDVRQHKGDAVGQLKLEITAQGAKLLSSGLVEFDEPFLGSRSLLLRVSREDQFVAFFQEVSDALDRKVPWYAQAMRPLTWAFGGLALVFVFQAAKAGSWLFYFCVGASLFCFAISAYAQYYLYSCKKLYLRRRYEVEGFWRRNYDKILTGIIVACFTIPATLLINRWLGPVAAPSGQPGHVQPQERR